MTSLSKTVAKKRGRPAGSKNKNKPAARDLVFKRTNNHASEINKLHNRILELETIRERLHSVIDRQEHKAIQYQAVIDYLETKLEIN
jgi:hypothetical protein